MKIKVLLVSLLFLGFVGANYAQTATPKVTKRQVVQKNRVKNGVKSGELTRKETGNIARQQKRINRSKKAAKSDGVVTKKERATIHARQNAASRNIARKKNNGRSRN